MSGRVEQQRDECGKWAAEYRWVEHDGCPACSQSDAVERASLSELLRRADPHWRGPIDAPMQIKLTDPALCRRLRLLCAPHPDWTLDRAVEVALRLWCTDLDAPGVTGDEATAILDELIGEVLDELTEEESEETEPCPRS